MNFRVNWRLLLAAIVLLWLVNTGANTIIETVELSPWIRALLLVVAHVSFAAFVVLIAAGGGYLIVRGVKMLAGLFPDMLSLEPEKDQMQETGIVTGADDVSRALEELGQRLRTIEDNRDEAIRKLQDADILAATLVSLIRRTVAKARSLATEGDEMGAALEALVSGDPVSIARVAGQLNDEHIRSLVLETKGDAAYRDSVIRLVATQLGALRSSSQALAELSNSWVESLAAYRAQTARLAVAIDVLDGARPLANLDANLRTAQSYLMMQGRAELHQVMRALPGSEGALAPIVRGYK